MLSCGCLRPPQHAWERHSRRLQPGTRLPRRAAYRGLQTGTGLAPGAVAARSTEHRAIVLAVLPQPAGTGSQAAVTARARPREGAGVFLVPRDCSGKPVGRVTLLGPHPGRAQLGVMGRDTSGSSLDPLSAGLCQGRGGGHLQGLWLCAGLPLAVLFLPRLPHPWELRGALWKLRMDAAGGVGVGLPSFGLD